LARILVYHKHVLTLSCSFLQVDNTDKEDLKLMARKAYAIKGFPYIDYEVIAPKQMQEGYKRSPIQIPVTKGTAITEMEKHVDYDDNFSPTPGIALARIVISLAAANNLELHSVEIGQTFTQADKFPEGVNGRYFINAPKP